MKRYTIDLSRLSIAFNAIDEQFPEANAVSANSIIETGAAALLVLSLRAINRIPRGLSDEMREAYLEQATRDAVAGMVHACSAFAGRVAEGNRRIDESLSFAVNGGEFAYDVE